MHRLMIGLSPQATEQITRAFETIAHGPTRAVRVLRSPLFPLTLKAAHPRRAHLHPVERAVLAADDDLLVGKVHDHALPMPLDRVRVFAAYLAFDWTPPMYEHAVECAARLRDDGMAQAAAERRAIALTRKAFSVPRTCGTCRFFREFSRTAPMGGCTQRDASVRRDDPAPECFARTYTAEEWDAALQYEMSLTPSTTETP